MNKFLVFFVITLFFSQLSFAAPQSAKLGTSKTRVNSPTSAAFFTREYLKIDPTETQWVSFYFNTGTVFQNNENAHLWISLDGTSNASKLLFGRGIVIGDTSYVSGCPEVAFEKFSVLNTHPGACGYINLSANTIYRVVVQVNNSAVTYNIYDTSNVLLASDAVYMPDELGNEELSRIQMGMAFDDNPAWFSVEQLYWGVF